MGVKLPDEPRGGRRAVMRALLRFAPHADRPAGTVLDVARELGADPGSLAISIPHRVYGLGLGDVAHPAPLSLAKPLRWSFLVDRDDEPVAIVETALRRTRGELPVTRIRTGAAAARLRAAVEAIDGHGAFEVGGHELRGLRIPALGVTCLWLHGRRGQEHLYPIEGWPASLSGRELCAPAALFDALRPLAERLRTSPTPARTP